jgi:GTPase Era involved in 16S rRNA processing
LCSSTPRAAGALAQRAAPDAQPAAAQAARDADVALFVVEALRFGPTIARCWTRFPGQRVIAVVNKIDTVKKQAELIPFLDRLSKTRKFEALVR